MPLISRRAFAQFKGVSHTAINNAVRDGRIPLVDGKIDSETPYEPEQGAQAALQIGAGVGATKAEAERGLIEVKRRREELALARDEKDSVSAAEVEAALGEAVTHAQARLRLVSAKLGLRFGLEVQLAAANEIDSALKELSEYRVAA